MINAELLRGLTNSRTEGSYRVALEAAAQDFGLNPSLMNNQVLVASFNGQDSCEAHVEALSRVFRTQISVHKSVRDGSVYESNSTDFLSGAAGVPCQLIGGIVHFDVALPADGKTIQQLQARSDQDRTLATVNPVSFESVSSRVAKPSVVAPIPAVVDSVIRGGGRASAAPRVPAAVQAPVPVSKSARALGALGAGAGMVANAASAVWNKMPTIRGRGRSAAPAAPVAPAQNRSRSAPLASSGSRASMSKSVAAQAIKKPANPNNELALGTKQLSESASAQATVDTQIITSRAPVLDVAFLESVTAKKTAPASVSKQEMGKISQADDYIAAVYQAALLKNPDASFDDVKNKITSGQVARFLDSNGLKQAAVFYKKYQAAPMDAGIIPVVVQP